MGVAEILVQIDRELAQLQRARTLLSQLSGKKAAGTNKTAATTTRRRLSPEGRKRIAEAVKKRWAQQRKKSPAK